MGSISARPSSLPQTALLDLKEKPFQCWLKRLKNAPAFDGPKLTRGPPPNLSSSRSAPGRRSNNSGLSFKPYLQCLLPDDQKDTNSLPKQPKAPQLSLSSAMIPVEFCSASAGFCVN